MTYVTKTYDFTAFAESDLGSGHIATGASFKMPASATVCFSVFDNDAFMSGDYYEQATDHSYQTAAIVDAGSGEEIGNGHQIYAESYFWVTDQHGNTYVLIEIEQEGTSGDQDYFTFYTGGGYTVPPEGAHLTVGKQCNVSGDWVDYKCLDAGNKEPVTGSISGTVFCDTDCDGVNGSVEVIAGHDYVVEAEDMHKYGFHSVHGSQASGGELVKLSSLGSGDDDDDDDDGGADGKLWTHFGGKDGKYDITVHVQDEDDGQSQMKLYVNGHFVKTVTLNEDDDGAGSDNGGFSAHVIKDVDLKYGDEIKLVAYGDGHEYVRVDKMVMEGHDKTVTTEEPVKEGVEVKLLDAAGNVVATTTTDANGNYTFDGLQPGDYSVMGVAPDGTEFTIKDAGNDDSRDSDVDQTGTSDTITVAAGSHTDIDLGVCDIKAGAITGTVFCDLDCDGINGELKVVPGHSYTIEAEHMHEYGFHTVHGAQASGGQLVKLDSAGGTGKLYTYFKGKDGTYDLKIRVQDENDGQSVIKLLVDGHYVDAVKLDGDSDGGGSNNGGFSTYLIENVDIDYGDKIKLVVYGDGHEFVRIDKIDIDGEDTTMYEPEPVKEGVTIKLLDAAGNVVATTLTDADGNYRFDDVPVGDYTVMGVAPDGTEFSPQDQGGDDTIDSDVDGNGMSGVITVTDGSVTDIDLGVCDKPFEECDDPNAVKVDFEGFAKGTVISTQYAGIAIEAQRATNNTPENDAMIFDSAHPTGGDTDLATANQGNILIISEDNDSSDPDDAIGGTITFTFDNPSRVFDLKVIDTEEGGTITATLADGTVQTFTIPSIGDGQIDQVILDVDDVKTLEVELNGSGAIDDLCYVPGEPAPASVSGRYFCDENGDDVDNGEPGVAGQAVTLLDAAGNAVATATTDSSGFYQFTGLEPGTYSVLFAADPTGKTFVAQDDPNNNGDDTNDSDADPATGQTAPFQLAAGEDKQDVDVGVEDPGTASVAGRYFCDENGDDIDNGEPGVGGLTVELLDAAGNVVATTTTDSATGDYIFTGLRAGTYSVQFAPDSIGKVFVAKDDPNGNGDDTNDSDVDPNNGTTDPFRLEIGENKEDVDAGVEDPRTAALGDTVFFDVDGDGIQDVGESGVANVTVELFADIDGDGQIDDLVATQTTDGNGNYLFQNLAKGDYKVTFSDLPAGTVFTVQDAGGDDAADSDADPANGMTGVVNLDIGEVDLTVDAGIVELPGSLSGKYFFDADRDGLDDDGVNGIGGVTVELLDAAGNPTGNTTTTAADGTYSFTDLEPGTYGVKFTDPDTGRELTTPNVGADDTIDSDAIDLGGGMSEITGITVVADTDTPDNDAGVVTKLASLGDKVFFDNDRDGIQDAGEAGVAGVTVTLTGGGADGVIGTADDTTDVTTTDANGEYLFDDLNPGEEYKVTFADLPTGFEFTTPDQGGDDTLDSDADPANGMTQIVTLAPDEFNDTLDAGIVQQLGSVSGRYFCDTDNDDLDDGEATDPGIPGVRVALFDAAGNELASTFTGNEGLYSFTGLEPGTYSVQFTDPNGVLAGKQLVDPNVGNDDTIDSDAIGDTTLSTISNILVEAGKDTGDNDAGAEKLASLGDRVFEDLNANGIQDAGESGIAGALVRLLDAAGTVLATDTTDADGLYDFDGLTPGDYRVEFVQPAGFDAASAPNQGGDDTVDSDGTPEAGNFRTGIISLDPGEDDPTNDQGFYKFAGLGDFVWEDLDGDGIQDTNEPGVDGVTVELKDANGNVIATTTTANGGAYRFDSLTPGTYSVAFVAPAGFAFTTADAGTDDTLDSDADPVTGMTQQITLTSGEFNGTLDAGLIVPNQPPQPAPDNAAVCSDEAVTIDVLANDIDPEGGALNIIAVDGQAISEGGSVTLSGSQAVVTLLGGQLVYDLSGVGDTFDSLSFGSEAFDNFSYTVEDAAGAVATSTVDVKVCGSANSLLTDGIPTTISFEIFDSVPGDFAEAFTVELTSADTRFDGLVIDEVYCVDAFLATDSDVLIGGSFALATEANADALGLLPEVGDNIDLINYILNEDFTSQDNGDGTSTNYTDLEIQGAIWELTNGDDFLFGPGGNPGDGPAGTQANVDEIVADALANGNGFELGDGSVVAAFLVPTEPGFENSQPYIVAFECECDTPFV